jgi:DNA mismatch repair ATPase MutS
VQNDLSIGHNGNNRGMTITGPNSSGKSVFMQQIALITYMSHLGSFVPCSKASIAIVDKIITRLRTKTSISLNESSFLTGNH